MWKKGSILINKTRFFNDVWYFNCCVGLFLFHIRLSLALFSSLYDFFRRYLISHAEYGLDISLIFIFFVVFLGVVSKKDTKQRSFSVFMNFPLTYSPHMCIAKCFGV